MALGTPEQEVLLRWVCHWLGPEHVSASSKSTADRSLQVNTFPLDFKVESLEDLSDGTVLSKILGKFIPLFTPRISSNARIMLTSTMQRILTPRMSLSPRQVPPLSPRSSMRFFDFSRPNAVTLRMQNIFRILQAFVP